ncbi:hypothetical protein [Spongiimicrobium salis]|uniref:hypothetical protein n=1 Tax=Spongiimicrobium salis TaxID=1667022 RepID=UPI00374DA280
MWEPGIGIGNILTGKHRQGKGFLGVALGYEPSEQGRYGVEVRIIGNLFSERLEQEGPNQLFIEARSLSSVFAGIFGEQTIFKLSKKTNLYGHAALGISYHFARVTI